MSSVDIDTVMPAGPHQRQAGGGGWCASSSAPRSSASSWIRRTRCPKSRTKRRLSALGPGGLTRERAGFEVRDVHPTHYGRICPIETPEGPNIGLINSLATYARVNKYGFVETPYRKVKDGRVTDEVIYLSAMEEAVTRSRSGERLDRQSRTLHRRLDRMPPRRRRADGARRQGRLHGRIAEATGLGGSGVDSVPGKRRRQPRLDWAPTCSAKRCPLLRAEAPFVGTGMEGVVARDSGASIAARRTGIVDQVDATRIVVRATEEVRPDQTGRRHLSADEVPALESEHLHQSASAGEDGRSVTKGDIIADGPSTELGELALGRNVLVAFMRGMVTTSRTPSCCRSASSRTTSSPRSISRNSR